MNTETKATHTPGPWFLSAHYVRHRQSDGTKPNIASLECFGGPPPEGDANAFLIAAAPDLLESTRELIALLDEQLGPSINPVILKAMRAIAKAEGRQ